MADKIVEVPNIGRVSFPSTMTDDEIIRAIQSLQAPAALQPPPCHKTAWPVRQAWPCVLWHRLP